MNIKIRISLEQNKPSAKSKGQNLIIIGELSVGLNKSLGFEGRRIWIPFVISSHCPKKSMKLSFSYSLQKNIPDIREDRSSC